MSRAARPDGPDERLCPRLGSEEMGLTMAQRKAFTRELAQRYLRATPSR